MRESRAARAAFAAAVLLAIIALDFALVRLGGSSFVGELETAGLDAATQKELVRRHREEFHLDRPLHVQFGLWFSGLLHGDLGRSSATNEPVLARLAEVLPDTLILQATALVIIFTGGVLIGIRAAVRKGGTFDRVASGALLGLHSAPVFWIGALLLLAFAGRSGLGLFPLEKLHAPDAPSLSFGGRFADTIHHLILPVTCLVLPSLASVARHARAEMIRVLDTEYVLAARAAGHSERRIVYRYALRNALGPVVVLLGAEIPSLIGGSVVVETLFNIDGTGRALFSATFEHDYPMLQALFLLTALATFFGQALSDFLQRALLPRLRDR